MSITSLFTWLMDQLTIQTWPTCCRACNEFKLKQPELLVTLHHRPLLTNFRLFFHSKGKYCTIHCSNELIFIKSNLAVLLWYIFSLCLPLRCITNLIFQQEVIFCLFTTLKTFILLSLKVQLASTISNCCKHVKYL